MTGDAEAVVKAIALLNEGDIDSYYEMVADDCVMTSAMGVLRGKQAILDGDRAILLQMDPHWRRLDKGPIVSGTDIVFWGTFGGTVKATGKAFESEICNVIHMRDGKIVAWESYSDLSKSIDAWS